MIRQQLLSHNSNGHSIYGTLDPILRNKIDQIVANATSLSREAMAKGLSPDRRRDIDDECGYPKGPQDSRFYQDLYDYHSIAARVVEVMPKECWQADPLIYEDEDSEKDTEFEAAIDGLGTGLRPEKSYFKDEKGSPVLDLFRRADEQSGIGRFGVILLGLNDGGRMDEPIGGAMTEDFEEMPENLPHGQTSAGAMGTDAQYVGVQMSQPTIPTKKKKGIKLVFTQVFPESLVQIVQFESNTKSPRFQMPVRYRITLNDPQQQFSSGIGLPTASIIVHWTRIIHIADNLASSKVFGIERMRQVRRELLGLAKLYGAGPEGYWKSCFTGLSFETNPQLGGDVIIDKAGLMDQYEQFINGLQRAFVTTGMSVKTLAPSVVDPSSQIDKLIEAICIKTGCPKRVFMGSERGELASSQDDDDWNGRVKGRRNGHCTTNIIIPFVDRLISVGVLPEPKKGYHVEWPDTIPTEEKKADIAVRKTQAMSVYVASGVEAIMTPMDFFVRIMGMTEEEAEVVIEAAEEKQMEKELNAQAMSIEHGFEPMPPDGFTKPQPQPMPGMPGAQPHMGGVAGIPRGPSAKPKLPSMMSGSGASRMPSLSANGLRVNEYRLRPIKGFGLRKRRV